MFVANNLRELHSFSPRGSVATLGVFDGVHLGHRAIVDEVVRRRDEVRGAAWLITFDPHPLQVTGSRQAPSLLSTVDERLDLLSRTGLDGVFVVRFDARTAALDYREFTRKYILEGLDAKALVLGYDCRFGRGRHGDPGNVSEFGRRAGFEVRVVEPRLVDGRVVSSTHIRDTLRAGALDTANRLLGHPYLLSGVVRRGSGRGKTIGFPTANVNVADPWKLWPPRGVYAVGVEWDGRRAGGMMNVGTSPTVKGGEVEAEVNIFDFDGDLYGRSIRVHCVGRLRDERVFPSVEELASQLERDREAAKKTLETGRSNP